MENDTVVDVQAETEPDESMTDDDLLATSDKGTGLGIKDGSSNT